MILLGLDLSLASTGWACLDFDTGMIVGYGVIQTTPKDRLSIRLAHFADGLEDVLAKWKPFDVYMESPISFGSATATLEIGMIHGVARLILHETCDFSDPGLCNPSTLKKHATGRGKAGKDEMVMTAEAKWDLSGLNDDEADAAWVADYGYVQIKGVMDS